MGHPARFSVRFARVVLQARGAAADEEGVTRAQPAAAPAAPDTDPRPARLPLPAVRGRLIRTGQRPPLSRRLPGPGARRVRRPGVGPLAPSSGNPADP